MISLFFTACLITNPTICKDYTQQFEGDYKQVTPMQCYKQGQTELSKWYNEHLDGNGKPKYLIKRIKCGDADRKKIDI